MRLKVRWEDASSPWDSSTERWNIDMWRRFVCPFVRPFVRRFVGIDKREGSRTRVSVCPSVLPQMVVSLTKMDGILECPPSFFSSTSRGRLRKRQMTTFMNFNDDTTLERHHVDGSDRNYSGCWKKPFTMFIRSLTGVFTVQQTVL